MCILYNTNECTNEDVLSASNRLNQFRKIDHIGFFSTNQLNSSVVDLEQVQQAAK